MYHRSYFMSSMFNMARRRAADSAHGVRSYPNRFKGAIVERFDQVEVADDCRSASCIRLPTALIYLVRGLDAFSRRSIGWNLMR